MKGRKRRSNQVTLFPIDRSPFLRAKLGPAPQDYRHLSLYYLKLTRIIIIAFIMINMINISRK